MVRALIVVRPDDADASRLADALASALRDGGVFTRLCATCTAPDGSTDSWEMLVEGFRSHAEPRPDDRRVHFRATLRRSPSTASPTMEVELSGATDLDGAREWGGELASLVRAEAATRDVDRIAGAATAAGHELSSAGPSTLSTRGTAEEAATMSDHDTTAPSESVASAADVDTRATDMRPIVVGVDGSIASAHAFHAAREIAELLDRPLTAVLAWQWPEAEYRGWAAGLDWSPERDARERLAALVAHEFGNDGAPPWFTATIAAGSPAAVLIDSSSGGQLLVVGGRGHGGFAGLLLGSVSEAVSRHASCPVLVVREDRTGIDDGDGRPIVVGVDGSPGSLEALRVAAEAARTLSCPLEVLSVWHEPTSFMGGYPLGLTWSPEEDARAALVRSLETVLGPEPAPGVSGIVREGRAASVLIRAAAHARALVVGARGHGGFQGLLLGSVSDECVRHSLAPVLVVPDALRTAEREAIVAEERAQRDVDPFAGAPDPLPADGTAPTFERTTS